MMFSQYIPDPNYIPEPSEIEQLEEGYQKWKKELEEAIASENQALIEELYEMGK